MTALAMQLELKRLSLKHGIHPAPFTATPCIAPDHDIAVEGFASTDDIDLARQKFRKWAFDFLPWGPLPPLLYRHTEPAGEILEMSHDERGRLTVRARVTHPEAKKCTISLSAPACRNGNCATSTIPRNFTV
jgi:hypothetical protein